MGGLDHRSGHCAMVRTADPTRNAGAVGSAVRTAPDRWRGWPERRSRPTGQTVIMTCVAGQVAIEWKRSQLALARSPRGVHAKGCRGRRECGHAGSSCPNRKKTAETPCHWSVLPGGGMSKSPSRPGGVKFQTPANDRGPLRFWGTGSRNPSPHAELPPPADPQAIDRLSLGLFL